MLPALRRGTGVDASSWLPNHHVAPSRLRTGRSWTDRGRFHADDRTALRFDPWGDRATPA